MSLLAKILAIIGSAMFAGVMLAIGIILGGFWKSLPPDAFLEWFAQHSHFVMRAIPLVVIPTLIGLAGTLWFDWTNVAQRCIWLGAAGCILVVLLLTLTYFLPINAAFVAKSIPLDEVSGSLDSWLLIHNLRIALAIAASALGVWAISRSEKHHA